MSDGTSHGDRWTCSSDRPTHEVNQGWRIDVAERPVSCADRSGPPHLRVAPRPDVCKPMAVRPPTHGDNHRSIAYRPALDGIRALAVLAVMLYHGGVSWLPGGFLGVDAFFVLSGFLIPSLLLAEGAATGRIRLGAFWLRRARRLLPALLVMLVCIVLAYRPMLSIPELALLRGDALAALGYVANWRMIYRGDDYFAQTATASPLQHTWSL